MMGDRVGGDKIGGDKVGGDKVIGNKGDTYLIKNSPGSGRNVHMQDVGIRQEIRDGQTGTDLDTLSQELERLRQEMRKISSTVEQDISVAAVAQAEAEAKKGDESKALSWLSKAGEWALDVGTKIGVSVATEAIKKSLGQ